MTRAYFINSATWGFVAESGPVPTPAPVTSGRQRAAPADRVDAVRVRSERISVWRKGER